MSAANSHAPQVIGNYVIEHALAHGSMGTVYVARHSLTYARVALKVLRTEPTGDKQAEERFLREVRAAAQIGHDGIVKVQDAGKTGEGHLFLAMELLTGETIEERIARSPGERLTAMDWLLAVLEPLSAAHDRSIVHRDLKPANVFIARRADGTEHIKLLDFGLARDTREKSGTQTGIALGTPYYMSPEQAARPKDVSPASDVWSMGVMMYEVLTGCMPFDGETLHAVVIQAATMPHVPVRDRAPSLDPRLAALVDECLSKRPDWRPRDASELRARLGPLLDDEAVRADLANALPSVPPDEPYEVPRDPARMPFADTAIALAHDSRIQDVHPRVKTTGLGLWISTFAALALLIAGFFWVLERSTQQTSDLSAMPPSPAPRGSAVPARPLPPEPTPPPAAEPIAPQAPAAAEPTVESRRDHPSPRLRSGARRGANPESQPSAAEAAPGATAPGETATDTDTPTPPPGDSPAEASPPPAAAEESPPAATSGATPDPSSSAPAAPPIDTGLSFPHSPQPPEPEHAPEADGRADRREPESP